jgi:hypothetical protein
MVFHKFKIKVELKMIKVKVQPSKEKWEYQIAKQISSDLRKYLKEKRVRELMTNFKNSLIQLLMKSLQIRQKKLKKYSLINL